MRSMGALLLASVFLTTVPASTLADPLDCDLTFVWDPENQDDNLWDNEENWGPNFDRTPDEDDNVCIINGPETIDENFVLIRKFGSSYAAHARAIWIDENARIEIYGDETLTLHGEDATSTIDGLFELCPPFDQQSVSAGKIILAADHIITNSGSSGDRAIRLLHASASIEAASGSGAVLTIGSGFTVSGTGELKLPIVNNGIINPQKHGRTTGSAALSGEMTIYEAITLNGQLLIDPLGTALLTANQIVPSGGIIELQSSGGDAGKLKPRPSYSPTLTVNSGGLIKGSGELHIKPVNNGTVAARNGILELKQGGDGSGKWTSETSTGNLLVSAEVKGAGTWELDDHASAKIQITAACECLTGNVTIYAGTLDVDANFRTTNQLSLSNESTLIDVASNKSARFSVPTLPACTGGGGGGD